MRKWIPGGPVEGWKRLMKHGKFIQPKTSNENIESLREIGSPVMAFVEDCCLLLPGNKVAIPDAYTAWQIWNQEQGSHPTNERRFGADLRVAAGAAVPVVKLSGESGSWH